MFFSIAQIVSYTIAQTIGVSIFTISLKRLGKLPRVYRLRVFGYLLLVNVAGALTFGADAWLRVSKPTVAAIFIFGVPFMLGSHLYLLWRYKRSKK